MEKAFLFLVVVFFTVFSGCDSYCDGGQPKNGLSIERYDNGNIESKTEVKNCLCHGNDENYYMS